MSNETKYETNIDFDLTNPDSTVLRMSSQDDITQDLRVNAAMLANFYENMVAEGRLRLLIK